MVGGQSYHESRSQRREGKESREETKDLELYCKVGCPLSYLTAHRGQGPLVMFPWYTLTLSRTGTSAASGRP